MKFPIAFAYGAIATIILGAVYAVRDAPKGHTGIGVLSIVIMASIIGQAITDLATRREGVNIAFSNLRGMYGFFYLLYYVLPYLFLLFAGGLPERNELLIACLIGIAFVSWRAGVGPPSPKRSTTAIALSDNGTAILLGLCIIGICFVVYLYIWRTVNGIFFTQARYYEQALTIDASLRDVFIGGLQLPIIIVLGAVGSVAGGGVARLARRILLWYGILLIVLFMLSSQTRPAITALILLTASRRLYTSSPIKGKHVLAMGAVSLMLLVGVQGGRIAGRAEFENAENQFTHALGNVVSNAVSTMLDNRADMQSVVIDRASGGIIFLSDVIDGVREEGRYLYGRDVLQTLFQLIPRSLWADKPSVAAPQTVVEELLGLPLNDTSVGPITQFYAWGGVISVGLCYFIFGWGLGRLAKWVSLSRNMGRWIVFAFVISQVVVLEYEVTLGVLTSLRNALVAYVIWKTVGTVFTRPKIWLDRNGSSVAKAG